MAQGREKKREKRQIAGNEKKSEIKSKQRVTESEATKKKKKKQMAGESGCNERISGRK